MKPDDLKKIGNALGWTDFRIIDNMFASLTGIPADDFREEVFNPAVKIDQLADCEEWLLSEDFTVESDKFLNMYTVKLSKTCRYNCWNGKTKAEALLNAMLEVIENEN